jgi:hypothetical protein
MKLMKGVKTSHYRTTYPPASRPSSGRGCFAVFVLLVGAVLQLLSSAFPVATSPGRRGRCYRMRRDLAHVVEVQIRRQPSWLSGAQETEVVRGPDPLEALRRGQPLQRRHMRALMAQKVLRGVPVCAEQGPLRRPTSSHYDVYLLDDGQVTLRCRVHGW